MKILVTGACGFIGKNVIETLKTIQCGKNRTFHFDSDIVIYAFDKEDTLDSLNEYLSDCDFIINLAGVNRPDNAKEFYEGNSVFIDRLCNILKGKGNKCPILNASSIQVGNENDYAKSKERGERFLIDFGKENGNLIYIYRFANLFGKWSKPNYNSVVATWCDLIANDKAIAIKDPSTELSLCYIDDVVEEILNCMVGNVKQASEYFYQVSPIYKITLKDLARTLISFRESRNNLQIIKQGDDLTKKLYATYLSYLPKDCFSYPLKMNIDERGSFTEFLKTKDYGQVSINITHPGIVKGNHWHHTKNEKFLVVSGNALLQFRNVTSNELIQYCVSGNELEVVDIPTGYTHNIVNIGETDLVTVMWANESFNEEKPDTYFEEVEIE